MVVVEVRVDVVEVAHGQQILPRIVAGVEVGKRRAAAQLVAQKCAKAREKQRLSLGEEERQLAVKGRLAVDVCGQGTGCAAPRTPGAGRAPFRPRLGEARALLQAFDAVAAEIAFVDEADAAQRGFLGEAAPGESIGVREEEARPFDEVAVGGLVEGAHELELAVGHGAVAVDADGAPGHGLGARDEEVGGEVEAVPDAGGDKGVELLPVPVRDVERGAVAARLGPDEERLVVMDADRVEAHAREVRSETVGVLRIGYVGPVDEVHTAEADFLAGAAFELEVVADGDDATELPRRLMVRHDAREVERGAGLDPVGSGRRRERNPVGAGLCADGFRNGERERRPRDAEDGAGRIRAARLDAVGDEDDAQRDALRTPAGVVLHEDFLRLGELQREPGDCRGQAARAPRVLRFGGNAEELEIPHLSGEDVWRGRDGVGNRDVRLPGQDAAGDVGLRDRALDADEPGRSVAAGRDAPRGLDAAVAGLAEGGVAVEEKAEVGGVFRGGAALDHERAVRRARRAMRLPVRVERPRDEGCATGQRQAAAKHGGGVLLLSACRLQDSWRGLSFEFDVLEDEIPEGAV